MSNKSEPSDIARRWAVLDDDGRAMVLAAIIKEEAYQRQNQRTTPKRTPQRPGSISDFPEGKVITFPLYAET